MKRRPILFLASLWLLPIWLSAQTLDPEALRRPLTDTWPTYNGDYSGQRYSTLSQINASNVKSLALAWTHHVDFGAESYAQQASEGRRIKSTPLLVGGVLYFTITDNVWAIDALTGRELWHYAWPNNRAIHVANRGVGMYGSWLYFMSTDNYLVSLNAKDGTERWRWQVADVKLDFFSPPRLWSSANTSLSVRATTTISAPGWNLAIPKPEHCNGSGGSTRSRAPQARRHGWTTPPWRRAAAFPG